MNHLLFYGVTSFGFLDAYVLMDGLANIVRSNSIHAMQLNIYVDLVQPVSP